MKTINIKGSQYVEVPTRVTHFRHNNQNYSLQTDIIDSADNYDWVIMKTVIMDENQIVRSTGMAFEERGSSYINKGSHIENCETSAVGRALGFFGIGIDTSIASAEEVQNAKINQPKKEWLSESQFQAILKKDVEYANKVLKIYDGKTVHNDGKIYQMKKDYTNRIEKKFNLNNQ